jgi:hypothetical protein
VKMRADTEAVRNQTDLVNSRDMNELWKNTRQLKKERKMKRIQAKLTLLT